MLSVTNPLGSLNGRMVDNYPHLSDRPLGHPVHRATHAASMQGVTNRGCDVAAAQEYRRNLRSLLAFR